VLNHVLQRVLSLSLVLIWAGFGPLLAEETTVTDSDRLSDTYEYSIEPADASVASGSTRAFTLIGKRSDGANPTSTAVSWRLSTDSSEAGYFQASVFNAVRVGIATVEAVVGDSVVALTSVHVEPGALARIDLTISPNQVVGQPLLAPARMSLFDENDNLVTNYDLAANPITLVPDQGTLVPSLIDNPAWFAEGVINFLPAGVRYHGSTGSVGITAVADTVMSTSVIVRFNGYDILRAFDPNGDSIKTVYANLLTTALVTVQNNGNLVASSAPTLKSFFRSGGGSVKSFFTAAANGEIDTVVVDLPTDNLPGGNDTLVFVLQSGYEINSTVYASDDTMLLPVTVLIPTTLEFVSGSFGPDSIYAGQTFMSGFKVYAPALSGPVDSTAITMRLYSDTSLPAVATIFEGPVDPISFVDDTITYGALSSLTPAGLAPGRYALRLDFSLVSGGDVFALDVRYPDSMTVVAPSVLSFVDTSFAPLTATAGTETSFSFAVQLEAESDHQFVPSASNFTISGDGFSTTASLSVPSNILSPGLTTVSTGNVFIPVDQIGTDMNVSATVAYRLPGVANRLTKTGNFGGQTVKVEESPAVRIFQVTVQAPNPSSRVNTGQPFRLRCEIHNESNATIDPLPLRLSSDGASQFTADTAISNVNPNDSVVVFFDIVAALEVNPNEVFTVAVNSSTITELPPVDNNAAITIQTPASLMLSHSLPGAESGYVDRNGSFSLLLNMTNMGESAVSAGVFRLTSNGVNLGFTDPLVDTIRTGQPISVSMRAPDRDTTVVLSFSFDELPIDSNYALPAEIDVSAFEDTIIVTSLQADLLVDAEVISSSLVLPGATRNLFTLTLSNRGTDEIAAVGLDSVVVLTASGTGEPLDAGVIMDLSRTGFLAEDSALLTAVRLNSDRIVLLFDTLRLSFGESRTLTFQTVVRNGAGDFSLVVGRNHIFATFADERHPQFGEPVSVETPGGGDIVLNHTFASVDDRSLDGSLKLKSNPFNPRQEAASFKFYLGTPSRVELRIFTVTGEAVVERTFLEGELVPDAADGLVTFDWDGRNDRGELVLNGVYVVWLRVAITGEETTMKVAVLK
jgi:hypothetical protein